MTTENTLSEPTVLECADCGQWAAPNKMYGHLCWYCANN